MIWDFPVQAIAQHSYFSKICGIEKIKVLQVIFLLHCLL